jgi:sec-independent protein translocase protein TatA
MFPLLFDISGGELMVVLLFILLFFGSKGIPEMARTLGRTMRQVRDASNEVQREIQRGATEVTRAAQEQRRTLLEEKDTTVDPTPPEQPEGPAR